ncbi:MAG: hypothetical protein AABX84_02220 [Nanoarchaeota archaeon]
MKLKKCPSCTNQEESYIKKTLDCLYTLKESCPKCASKTKDAHYKFLNFGKNPEVNVKTPYLSQ